MRETWTVEEYRSRIGQEIGVSDWILVDQDRINRFADVTEDWAEIHVDVEGMRDSPFGGTIGHGFLTIALLAAMIPSGPPVLAGVTMGFNYGFDRLRLIAPIPSGKRIRGRFKLKDFSERSPGEYRFVHDVTVEIEGEEKAALVAEWLILARVG